jgi:hypothetical protein
MLTIIRHRFVRVYQSYFPKKLTADDKALVEEMLQDDLKKLYWEQPLCDQRHGLLVYQKAQRLFREENISDEELFLASCFHDVAKKDCRLNVTMRVIVASLLSFIPKRTLQTWQAKQKLRHRIWIYAEHSRLSYDYLTPLTDSQFVLDATLYHHANLENINISDQRKQLVNLFVSADTL